MSRSATEAAIRRIPFQRLHGFPKLFRTYCTDFPQLSDFFPYDWQREADRLESASEAAQAPANREVLVEVLAEQNKRWNASKASLHNVEALAQDDAVAVVTGQQLGLLGGPLYTLLKTLTTLRLARQLADETGRTVVPVFWLEGEDHDFEEIAAANLLRHNELKSLVYDHQVDGAVNGGPVGLLELTADIKRIVTELKEILPPSDFRPDLLAIIEDAYQPGRTLLDAFSRLMHGLLPESGLVCIDSSDKRLKRHLSPLFKREIEGHATSSQKIQRTSSRLEGEFHAQVQTEPTNLFLLDDAGRLAIDANENGFSLRGTNRTLTSDELMDIAEGEPERLSPNVVMRPIAQDSLLPTAAYVAGPGEISYFAQFRGVYDWADVHMPVIYPRASATLVEGKVQKVLDKYDIDVPDVQGDIEPLFQQLVTQQMEVDIEEIFGEVNRDIHQAINALKPKMEAVDATMGPSTEAARAGIINELEELKSRVLKAEKRQQDEIKQQLMKAIRNIFPGGKLQERTINPLYFLNKYGLDLAEELTESLSLETDAHQVFNL